MSRTFFSFAFPSWTIASLSVAAAFGLFPLQIAAATEGPGGVPTGLVVKMAGGTEPQLDLQEELLQDVQYRLTPEARLTFVKYGTCGSYVASGGVLTVGAGGPSIQGGKLETANGPCVKLHSLAFNTNPGVFVTRGVSVLGNTGGGLPQHSRRPELVLAGPNARRVVGAEITYVSPAGGASGSARTVAAGRGAVMQLVGKQLRLAGPELLPNSVYSIRLLVASGAPLPQYRFATTDAAQSNELDILRVD